MNKQHTLTNAVSPPTAITFFTNRPEPNTKVMEITKDGIWVNPDVSVDDTAKAVLDALDVYINKLVKEVVHQEREACADVANIALLGCERSIRDRVVHAIRARGEK